MSTEFARYVSGWNTINSPEYGCVIGMCPSKCSCAQEERRGEGGEGVSGAQPVARLRVSTQLYTPLCTPPPHTHARRTFGIAFTTARRDPDFLAPARIPYGGSQTIAPRKGVGGAVKALVAASRVSREEEDW